MPAHRECSIDFDALMHNPGGTVNTICTFGVEGEPASKANSRRLVPRGGKIASIKSEKALSYSDSFIMQCPQLNPLITDYVRVNIIIWYASWRPDLDESLILDLMQGRIYENDRQVVERYARRYVDPARPRIAVQVQTVAGGNYPISRRRRPRKQGAKEGSPRLAFPK